MAKGGKREAKKARSGSVEQPAVAAPNEPAKQRVYVQLRLDDPALIAYASSVRKQWQTTTTWSDDLAVTPAIVLVEADVGSDTQLHAMQSLFASYAMPTPAIDASCRLQVQNSPNVAGKRLSLTLQFSDTFKTFLAKTGNTLLLKLQSLGIKSSLKCELGKKGPRDAVLWALDETLPRKTLQDEIQDTNRQPFTTAVTLSTLMLTTPDATLSILRKGPSPASVDDDAIGSQIAAHVSFTGHQVIILRGLPGSGKSTLSRRVLSMATAATASSVLCSADLCFESPGGYYYEKSKLGEAHDACKAAFMAALADKVAVIVVDNTHSQLWEYEAYVTGALEAAYAVTVLEVQCDDMAMAQRMMYRNSHGVSFDVIARMHQRWEVHAHPLTSLLLLPPVFTTRDNRTALPLLLTETNDVYIAAVFLTPASKAKLLARFSPKHTNVVAEHMTLAFQPTIAYTNGLPLGAHVRLRVLAEYADSKGHCVRVEWASPPLPTEGQRVLHVTVSFVPEVSAVYSNELLADPNASIVDVSSDNLILDGVVGLALRPRSGPRWAKPQVLDVPAGVPEARRHRQLTLLHSAFDTVSDIDAVISTLERVAERGNHLAVHAPPGLVEQLEGLGLNFDTELDTRIPWSASVETLLGSTLNAITNIVVVVTSTVDVSALPSTSVPVAVHATSSIAVLPSLSQQVFDAEILAHVRAAWSRVVQAPVARLSWSSDGRRLSVPSPTMEDTTALKRLATALKTMYGMRVSVQPEALDVVVVAAVRRSFQVTAIAASWIPKAIER
ncbi:hypothetical protein SDRG_09191 [Saprolegnia diclina VS20]|uniref:tRNA ligase phosphodiesterase domain-containing protein n=1 Tax=Saprolegnia diclina (strain VS20) TaxID=1156394 RepID=T0RSN6_SAPDV|nr:hypothetical protein SDRG_09191 [Saprolegnia diclina VS20]EQC33207.1 hypothetical protein SDRG_09191 [Saprolegnia diclina VS20]|eukprot:XP_008613330.1 hypothetical protein SDRG_09191 [Saprolegnia diclina VS20]